MVSDLQEQIKEKEKENNEKINLCNNEINNLKQMIIENNKNLTEKINFLEKEISTLKNDKIILNEKIQTLQEKNKNIQNEFEEIENPWSNEKDFESKNFDYILKSGNYYAEHSNDTRYFIKSNHKFMNNKIYNLKYDIDYKKSDFRLGFGDSCKTGFRLKAKDTIGLTNEGLFVQGKHFKDIKLKPENKEIIFIINLKEEQRNFELFIDGSSKGKFNFKLDIIFGLAAICYGSIKIQTFRK